MSVKRVAERGKKWRATVYIGGHQYSKHFATKTEAEEWEVRERESVQRGAWVSLDKRKATVAEYAEQWLRGYGKRPGTVRQAAVHLARITDSFGSTRLLDISSTHVKQWVADLQREGLKASYVYALHRRLSQLFADAVDEGYMTRNPASRKTSPPTPKQRPFVATTEQVWALYDAMPDQMRGAVLLAAFAGLRAGEIVAMTVADVDFARGVVHPRVQYSDKDYAADLKTDASDSAVPVPVELMAFLAHVPARYSTPHLVVSMYGTRITPARLDVHFRRAADSVPGMPDGFRLHDLRHYFASSLIASGLDIKTVQARVRHKSAKVTLDVYGHLFPDRDDATRDALRSQIRRAEPAASAGEIVSLADRRRASGD